MPFYSVAKLARRAVKFLLLVEGWENGLVEIEMLHEEKTASCVFQNGRQNLEALEQTPLSVRRFRSLGQVFLEIVSY